jgi:hypothetical protein
MEQKTAAPFLSERKQNRNAFQFWFPNRICIRLSGSNIKWTKKSKIRNERPTFWETKLLQTLKEQDFEKKNFVVKNCA